MNSHERMIAALHCQEVDRPPVWMMRQAGRYLPEYRALKTKYTTKEMMMTPSIACEITLQPIRRYNMDAAILYSDILMIPDAMGMDLEFATGEGPKFSFAIDSEENFGKLNSISPNKDLKFVRDTIHLCIKQLPSGTPLLGFAGAPFTVGSYMVSGNASAPEKIKILAFTNPKLFVKLMEELTSSTVEYLKMQAEAGVIAVQLFDTWAGTLSKADYEKLALPYTQKIFSEMRKLNIPTLHYIKGGAHLLESMISAHSNAVSVDWRVNLPQIEKMMPKGMALQGNLDPDILRTTPELVRKYTRAMLDGLANPRRGYIANLGHGIDKDTALECAQAFIETVQKY